MFLNNLLKAALRNVLIAHNDSLRQLFPHWVVTWQLPVKHEIEEIFLVIGIYESLFFILTKLTNSVLGSYSKVYTYFPSSLPFFVWQLTDNMSQKPLYSP